MLQVNLTVSPMEFFIGVKKKNRMELINEMEMSVCFKIQCTESSSFRLQPSKGTIAARSSIIILEKADCTFLVLSKAMQDFGDGKWIKDCDVVKQYVPAQVRHQITNTTGVEAKRENDFTQATSPCSNRIGFDGHDDENIVRLLIKNSSRKACNKLTGEEVALIHKYKATVSLDCWRQREAEARQQRKKLQSQKKWRQNINPLHIARHDDEIASISSPHESEIESLSIQTESEEASQCCEPVDSFETESHANPNRARPTRCRDHPCLTPSCVWSRYMVEVCVQQLQQTIHICEDRSTGQATEALARIATSANELLILHRTNPYLEGSGMDSQSG
ncbi:hypothetical protein THRCLA_05506 [Thraustotheca clavata]|uniref:MSP domain-containing protein n=1 Tax=Thraustotheca clavata TaxID=74557 RepID=A0A1V9ZVR7_9STRA|nr:hypothetical protein THRCLA_05506 [Thraustotheca clavata]